jgi:AcrR family transcriptional regulator
LTIVYQEVKVYERLPRVNRRSYILGIVVIDGSSTSRLDGTPRTATQNRILDAALELFARHGVSGTSFQMIATALGVTKAAVYNQFKAKEDLVIAVTERELAILNESLAGALDATRNAPASSRARDELLTRVIDVAVERRGMVGTLQFDPVIIRLLAAHEPFQEFLRRLFGVLIGDSGDEANVPTVMFSGSIAVAVMHPLLADMDNDTLKLEISATARRMLKIPAPRQRGISRHK